MHSYPFGPRAALLNVSTRSAGLKRTRFISVFHFDNLYQLRSAL